MELTIGTWHVAVERVPAQQHAIAARYDDVAPRWHGALQSGGYVAAYHNVLERINTTGVLAHLRAGSRILDCGIGTGAFGLALARTTGLSLHITGIDLSARMLQVARRTLAGVARTTELHQATGAALPFHDQAFDAVISAHMLEHFSNPQQGLREMMRVLRPGAPLILAVTRPGWLDTVQQLRWQYSNRQLSALPEWIRAMGLNVAGVYPLRTNRPVLSHWQSRVYVAMKA